MKLTKTRLKQTIEEEIKALKAEGLFDWFQKKEPEPEPEPEPQDHILQNNPDEYYSREYRDSLRDAERRWSEKYAADRRASDQRASDRYDKKEADEEARKKRVASAHMDDAVARDRRTHSKEYRDKERAKQDPYYYHPGERRRYQRYDHLEEHIGEKPHGVYEMGRDGKPTKRVQYTEELNMKLSKEQLKQLVEEEVAKTVLTEMYEDAGEGDWYDLLRKDSATDAYAMEKAGTKGPGYSREDIENSIGEKISEALEAIQSGYGETMHNNGIDFSNIVKRTADTRLDAARSLGRELYRSLGAEEGE